MSAYFMLHPGGVNYLISCSEVSPEREFLLTMLKAAANVPVSIDQLSSCMNLDRKLTAQMVYRMLKNGWLKAVDVNLGAGGGDMDLTFPEKLAELSSTGEVVLADMHGLVIAASGFAQDKVKYLAALAARLLVINEDAQKRNMDLYNGQPWCMVLHWGNIQLMTQLINLGSLKFVLIVGGEARLNSRSFSNLLTVLVRRYHRG